ncbi:hypothetical protein AgCh_029117 [Apium graveolens]
MKNQLLDYGLEFSKIPIYCDNQSAIAMTGNPVQHSMTKHISIMYHFIREHVDEGTMELHFVPTDQQLADIFIKPLCEATFIRLINELGMVSVNLKNELSADKPDLSKEKKRIKVRSSMSPPFLNSSGTQFHKRFTQTFCSFRWTTTSILIVWKRKGEKLSETIEARVHASEPVTDVAENVTSQKETTAQSSDTLKRKKSVSSVVAEATPSLARRLKEMKARRYLAKAPSEDTEEAEEGDQESLISQEPVIIEALPAQAKDTANDTVNLDDVIPESSVASHTVELSEQHESSSSSDDSVSAEHPVPNLSKEELVYQTYSEKVEAIEKTQEEQRAQIAEVLDNQASQKAQLDEIQSLVELLLSLLLPNDSKKGEKVVKSKCSPTYELKKKDDEGDDQGNSEKSRGQRKVQGKTSIQNKSSFDTVNAQRLKSSADKQSLMSSSDILIQSGSEDSQKFLQTLK